MAPSISGRNLFDLFLTPLSQAFECPKNFGALPEYLGQHHSKATFR